MLYRFKAGFQQLATRFAGSSVTANHASSAGVVLFVAVAACFYFSPSLPWLLLCIPALSFLRFVANALDGLIARAQGTATPAGEVINELSDVVGDTLSYCALFFVYPAHAASVLVFAVSIWFCEFAGVLAKNLPNGVRGQESLGGGKPERAVLMSCFAVYLFFSPESAAQQLSLFLYCLSILTVLSGVLRITRSIKRARGANYTSHTSKGK